MMKQKNTLELFYVNVVDKCTQDFFSWGNKTILISTGCSADNTHKLNVSTDLKVWTESNENFFLFLDILRNGKVFTTTHIGDDRVLLFIQEIFQNQHYDFYLWITDGSRLHNVGAIVTSSFCHFDGSILHINGELFALYKSCQSDKGDSRTNNNSFVLARLNNKMESIKNVVETWRKSNNIVSTECGHWEHCPTAMPTDGLVGFLHIHGNKTKWNDEYNYANATVTEGEKVDNGGFIFNKPGAGVKWVVNEKKRKMQPYNFMKYGFTLALTVAITKKNGSDGEAFFFGVVMNCGNAEKRQERFGIYYDKDNKWKLIKNSAKTQVKETNLETKEEYQLTLISNGNGKISAYIDWQQLSDLEEIEAKCTSTTANTNFFFAAEIDGEALQSTVDLQATVTNVFLYNRPFSTEEIEHLKTKIHDNKILQKRQLNDTKYSKHTNKSENSNNKYSFPQITEVNESETKKDMNISTPRANTGNDTILILQSSNGAVRVSLNMSVLFFLLVVCVFSLS